MTRMKNGAGAPVFPTVVLRIQSIREIREIRWLNPSAIETRRNHEGYYRRRDGRAQ